ncbi:hypothetical protein WN51_13197 [Melipona quadrifasciata]|uniref:Uncharacterized protein n=1 Tax=Melipona quadrifasciata TaxID=166423 RepID=A0A0M9A1L3_9HYME|nr:hypothetical protein WN51_13197 [Melipona quadrifasciata]
MTRLVTQEGEREKGREVGDSMELWQVEDGRPPWAAIVVSNLPADIRPSGPRGAFSEIIANRPKNADIRCVRYQAAISARAGNEFGEAAKKQYPEDPMCARFSARNARRFELALALAYRKEQEQEEEEDEEVGEKEEEADHVCARAGRSRDESNTSNYRMPSTASAIFEGIVNREPCS